MLKKNDVSKLIVGSLVIACCSLFLSFEYGDKSQIVDRGALATKYFKQDAQWYIDNIPFFECSDKKIEEVYYYRWKLYKAHIRNIGEDGYMITEFLDKVSWDKEPYSSLNDATDFHIYEGRWLKNRTYLDGYINYMYRGGGDDRHFSEGIADAVYAFYLVNADSCFIENQLGVMQHVYNLWLDHYDLSKELYYIEPIADATEYTISSIDASGGKDGFRGGDAFRPTINSYMYGNALAIARIATMKGDTALARVYVKRAEEIKTNVEASLWSDSLHHFIDRYKVNNQFVHYWSFIRGRELAGYVPWCYNLPDDTTKFSIAWEHLMDTTKFLGVYGLRTNEPSYQYYMRQYRYAGTHPECQWNGPSWPFQETQVLEAMANLVNNYDQKFVNSSDYLKILRLYTQQHYLPDGELNLQEDYNPDTGKPIVGLERSSHYNHSCYNDLIITGLCGIRPSEGDTLTINPLVDSTIKYFCLDDLPYHGHSISVVYDSDGKKYHVGKGVTIFVDGKKVSVKETGSKHEVSIGPPIVIKPEKKIDLALNITGRGFPMPTASINSGMDSLYKAIDGRIWYFPEITNRWSTYGSSSVSDWYALDFGGIRDISSARIYFFGDNATFGRPDDYTVEYLDGGQWRRVHETARVPSSPVCNTANSITFDTVATTAIRFTFWNTTKKFAVAVAEIELF